MQQHHVHTSISLSLPCARFSLPLLCLLSFYLSLFSLLSSLSLSLSLSPLCSSLVSLLSCLSFLTLLCLSLSLSLLSFLSFSLSLSLSLSRSLSLSLSLSHSLFLLVLSWPFFASLSFSFSFSLSSSPRARARPLRRGDRLQLSIWARYGLMLKTAGRHSISKNGEHTAARGDRQQACSHPQARRAGLVAWRAVGREVAQVQTGLDMPGI